VVVDDVLWIAWESNRDDGTRQVFLTAVRNGKVDEPVRLSRPGTNNYQPSIVATRDGALWIAWHSFRGNNTDLYARVVADGVPGPERRMTFAAAIDRDVRLAVAGDEVWMAWEHAAPLDYQLGKAVTKRVQVARIAADGLLAPTGIRETGLWTDAESPDIGLDGHGRVWIAARVVRDRNAGWDTCLWLVDREGWTGPFVLSARKGMNRRPAMALLGDTAAVVFQADDMPGRWLSVEASTRGSSGVYLSVAEHEAATDQAAPRLAPYRPPGDAYAAASIRVARGEDRLGWSVEHGEATYRLFFGDLHEHSDLSVCDRAHDETPYQSFQMMRDVARFDFGALTDHGKCFNAYLWSHLGKVTRANTDPGRFLTLLGQEWTSTFEIETPEYPYGYYGHRNIFLADPYHPTWYNAALDIKPSALRKQLQQEKADFVIIPHQLADTGNVPVDWNRVDTNDEPVAEIFQMRGSYECKGCPREARLSTPKGYFLQDAWARGIVIGVVASPDHEGGWGKAAVYAPALERKDILEALRARRCYGTTGAKILLDVRVDGLFMGEIGKPPDGKPVRVKIRVDCPALIETIEVIRNNDVVHTSRPGTKKKELEFVDAEPPDGPAYYYVRITQQDGEMAWSSPVWLGRLPRTMSRNSNPVTKRKPDRIVFVFVSLTGRGIRAGQAQDHSDRHRRDLPEPARAACRTRCHSPSQGAGRRRGMVDAEIVLAAAHHAGVDLRGDRQAARPARHLGSHQRQLLQPARVPDQGPQSLHAQG